MTGTRLGQVPISADNPENTTPTRLAISIMTDRDTPAHSATTERETEPLKLQSLR
jgi:hypothetical protein